MEDPILVAEDGGALAVQLDDRGLAYGQLVQRAPLALQVATDQLGPGADVLADEALCAGQRFHAGGIEYVGPWVVPPADQSQRIIPAAVPLVMPQALNPVAT